jgi:CheY-like chemotaxis protein
MVIEDDPDLMRIIVRTLQMNGFEVIQAYGGEDAMRKMKLRKPDMIFTDLAMPKMTGVDVIRAVKKDPETRTIPCVAVTAYMWDTIATFAGQAGCDGFIAKPFKASRLLDEVAKHIDLPGRLPSRPGGSSDKETR